MWLQLADMRRSAVQCSRWTRVADAALTEIVQGLARRTGVVPMEMDAVMLEPTEEVLMRYKVLEGFSRVELRARFAILKHLVRRRRCCWPRACVSFIGCELCGLPRVESSDDAAAELRGPRCHACISRRRRYAVHDRASVEGCVVSMRR